MHGDDAPEGAGTDPDPTADPPPASSDGETPDTPDGEAPDTPDGDTPDVDLDAARSRLLTDHADTLGAVLAAADAVATRVGGRDVEDGDDGDDDDGRTDHRDEGSGSGPDRGSGDGADGGEDPTLPRTAVAEGLERELDRRGLDGPLLAALTDAVAAAGRELRAEPVAAPPYLTVTARGPVLRGTVADGRLVVAVAAVEPVGTATDAGRGDADSGADGTGTGNGGTGTGGDRTGAGSDRTGVESDRTDPGTDGDRGGTDRTAAETGGTGPETDGDRSGSRRRRPRYRRVGADPAAALDVRFRRSPDRR